MGLGGSASTLVRSATEVPTLPPGGRPSAAAPRPGIGHRGLIPTRRGDPERPHTTSQRQSPHQARSALSRSRSPRPPEEERLGLRVRGPPTSNPRSPILR